MQQVTCEVKAGGQPLFQWRRFVAVGTRDDPGGCRVAAACPATDLGAVPAALVQYVMDTPVPRRPTARWPPWRFWRGSGGRCGP